MRQVCRGRPLPRRGEALGCGGGNTNTWSAPPWPDSKQSIYTLLTPELVCEAAVGGSGVGEGEKTEFRGRLDIVFLPVSLVQQQCISIHNIKFICTVT